MNASVKVGDRIRLIEMADEKYHPVPSGSTGTVKRFDDAGDFWVDWDGLSNNLKILPEIDRYEIIPKKVLCFDLETTGLDTKTAEVLQFAAVISCGEEEKTYSDLYRPVHASVWPEAEAVNGISPESVRGKYPFDCECNLSRLQNLFDEADVITGYNIEGYDIPILRRYGINVPEEKVCDCMSSFAAHMQKSYGSAAKSRYKLCEAAVLAGNEAKQESFHDALYDCRITMMLYRFLERAKNN